MAEIPRRGLLAHWAGTLAPGGRLYDRSPESNHGSYGPAAKWVWFTNPRAVRFVGKRDRTYVGYLGGATGRDIVVGTYDHSTRRFDETIVATDVSSDDHVGPAVFARNDGHLLTFWSGHDGPWMKYRITEDPEDPGTFGPVHQLDGDAICYPNPIQPGDEPGGPIYLFYRDRAGTGDGHPHYRVSLDGGVSFSEPTRLVSAPEGHYSVYWITAERDGKIHLFFTDAEGPSTGPKWNVAYARFVDGTLSTVEGTTIATESGLPATVEDLEVIYDASDQERPDAWIWDCGVDADGTPVAVYATFPTTHSHGYHYTRFDGNEWNHREIVGAGRYVGADPVSGYFSGGMALSTLDPDVVYAAVSRGEGAILKRFETGDAGRTFTSETVTPRAVAANFRPVVPENHSRDVPVVWLAGAYNHLDGCQTALRGIPNTTVSTGGPLVCDGHSGVSLGIDCYRASVFERGLTLAASFETQRPDRPQTLVDFGGGIRLGIADEKPKSVTCSLGGTTAPARCTVGGVVAGRKHCAVTWWDGDRVHLRLDEVNTANGFEGTLGLADGRRGWTIGKSSHFDGTGLDGQIHGVALYNRPLSTNEREKLRSRIDESGTLR